MSIDNSLLVEEQGRISNSDDLKIKKARPILRKVRPRNDVNLGSRTKRNVLVAKYRINAKPKESDFNNNGNQAVRRVVCEQDDRPPSNEYTTVKNASVHSKYNDTYNKGPFTTTEKNAVKEALEEFMRDNGISKADLPMLFMRSKSVVNQKQNMFKGRREWTSWLIKVYKKCNLNRTLTQFSHHIRRAFRDNLSKGAPWTKEEDDALIGLYALKGSKWGEIERELGRRNARSRYIRLQHLKNNSAKLGRYTYEELYKLGMVVKNIAIRENLKDLKAFNLWSMVEKEIDGRSAAQLQKCWSSRSALILANLDYDPSSSSENRKLWEASGLSNTWTLRDDMKLINLMCDLCEKASDETEVIWESLLLPEWRDKYASTPLNSASMQFL